MLNMIQTLGTLTLTETIRQRKTQSKARRDKRI